MRIFEPGEIKSDPSSRICEYEYKESFLCFCSLICIIHNKKLNLANIFLLLLKDDEIMILYKRLCDFDNDYGALRCFLAYDSTLHKSKYIKKYLNARNGTTSTGTAKKKRAAKKAKKKLATHKK